MARRVVVFLLAIIMSMSGVLATSAQAAPVAVPDRASIKITLTSQTADGQPRAAGDCGVFWLGVTNRGNGVAVFDYGYNVTAGIVYFHAIRVVWANLTAGRIDHFTDNKLWLRTHYSETREVTTGAGHLRSAIGVVVRLTNDLVCYGAAGYFDHTIT